MADEMSTTTLLPLSPSHRASKASKRRSLLMQPGTMVAATRRGISDLPSPPLTKQRPSSLFNPTFSSLAELAAQFSEDAEDSTDNGAESGMEERAAALSRLTGDREALSPTKRTRGDMGPPPKPTAKSTLGRSQSLRKPGSVSESSQSANGRSQVRTMGAPTRMSRPLSTLQESKPSRPVSSASSASGDGHFLASRTKLATTAQPTSNGGSSLAVRRATSTSKHNRAQSALPAISSTTGLARLDVAASNRRRGATGVSEFSPPSSTTSSITSPPSSQLGRPAFSTNQQHYSPRKTNAPKPTSASLMNSSPPLESNSLALETQLAQVYLLQLSIFHKQFDSSYKSYIRSAQKRIRKKFEATAAQALHVQDEEKKVRLRRNVAALKMWGANTEGSDGGFEELVQSLSGAVNEVSILTEEGGRVECVVDQFERWMRWVEGIWTRRDRYEAGAEADFIDGLGDAWRAETTALIRRLANLKRLLEVMPPAKKGSSLAQVVAGLEQLAAGTLDELSLLSKTEAMVVEREQKWVDERIEALAGSIGIPVQ